MIQILARHSSLGAASTLRCVLTWPARVAAERRTMAQLARMSDIEMHDIGLVRQDTVDVSALSLDADASSARRRFARGRTAPGRIDIAA